MIETKIYVGLNDADTLEQKHDTLGQGGKK